jgi:putative acetyltransferase
VSAKVTVRTERPQDQARVFEVHRLAYGRTGEAELVEKLRREEPRCISLVAADEELVVGHIFFTPVAIERAGGSQRALGLGPLGVVPERQDEGIGSRLVEGGLEACRRAGHRAVVVLGFPPFFTRFGFEPAHHWRLHHPDTLMRDAFMALELVPGALRGGGGVVKYHPLFAGLE